MKTINKVLLSLSLIASYGLNAFTGITSSEIKLYIETEVSMQALNVSFLPQTDYGALEQGEIAVSLPNYLTVSSSLSNTYDLSVRNVDEASNMVLLNDDNTKSLEFQLAIASKVADGSPKELPKMVGIVNKNDYEGAVEAGNNGTGELVHTGGDTFVTGLATTSQYVTQYAAYFTYDQWVASGIDTEVDDQVFTGTVTWTYTSN